MVNHMDTNNNGLNKIAWNRNRTGTGLSPTDFKSVASTCSAIQAFICCRILFLVEQPNNKVDFSFFYFTISSYILSNACGNNTAMFESTFLLRAIHFLFIVPINWEYVEPRCCARADILSIQSCLKSLFFNFLEIYACCPCFTRASLTCLYKLPLPNLNPFARSINDLCLACLCSPFLTLTMVLSYTMRK